MAMTVESSRMWVISPFQSSLKAFLNLYDQVSSFKRSIKRATLFRFQLKLQHKGHTNELIMTSF